MLSPEVIKEIEEFVYQKPRTIQEIATILEKNWRTADRYVEEIEKNFGTLSTRVFRGGTRGALKVVYWTSIEKVSSSMFQRNLEKEIFSAKKKEDFSSFDIFQYVAEENRSFIVKEKEEDNLKDLKKILLSAEKQILFFSGNLSFINLRNGELNKVFEELLDRNVVIKVLSRVDLAGKDNIENFLSLNLKFGKDLIEIRHCSHPLRGLIIDGKFIRLKEVSAPTKKVNELDQKIFIFYNISDKSWVEWFSKIFWKKFSNSIDANKRLELLEKIKLES